MKLLGLLLLAPLAYAGTYTAASCSQSDVNAVINGGIHTAVDGDIINVPSGTCTWTSGISVPASIGITIIGSGTPNSGGLTTGASASCSATIIIDQLSSGTLFGFNPTYGNSTTRLSCMEIETYTPYSGYGSPINVSGTCNSSGCPNVRLDNLTIPTGGLCSVSDASFSVITNMFGVLDHNTVGDTSATCNGVDLVNVGHGTWQGTGQWGDNSWATADTFGTNQQLYVENNSFNTAFGTDADRYATNFGGGRFTCRFNTFANITGAGACTNHGTDTGGRLRGGRQMEFYGNDGTSCTGGACNTFAGSRSGAIMMWGNTFTGQFLNSFLIIDTKRRWDADSWGACDGSSAWDVNDGTTYYSGTIGSVGGSTGVGYWTITDSGSPGWTTNEWSTSGAPYSFHDVTKGWGYTVASNTASVLTTETNGGTSGNGAPIAADSYQILRATVCLDQGARGQGLLVHDTVPGNAVPVLVSTGNPGSVAQALDVVYEGAETGSSNHAEMGADTAAIIPNRDFYSQTSGQTAQTSATSPFNGTTGTGYGTLARRPTTCTPAVGYFATDQGSWNTSGNSFGQGLLYVCTSTNTWTLYYTPYTYPHPLDTGGSSSAGGVTRSGNVRIAGPVTSQ